MKYKQTQLGTHGGRMMMKNIILFIPVLCLLCGCVYAKDVYTSDGDLAYNVVCGGTLNSWDNCYTKAGKICKEKGYEVLKQDESQYDIPLNPGQRGVNRNLIIRCKK